MTATPDPNAAAPALIFIPDISGFTRFVQSTEISHSRHIIEELLGKLVAANESGLQISEIEGDAILYYRFGDPPGAGEFFAQVRKMFLAFHGHLRLYATQRICRCGACISAQDLSLKIIAHYGPLTLTKVHDRTKLFGQDLIAAHRLLKNDVPEKEYALFTHALADRWPSGASASWAGRTERPQTTDMGKIECCSVPLAPLMGEVPEPRTEDYGIPGRSVNVFTHEEVIHAPMESVFATAIDLPTRLQWMEGARKIELLNDRINRPGTKHRCIVDEKSPAVVTSGSTREEGVLTLAETDEKRVMSSVYTFRREGENRTRAQVDGFVKDNLVVRTMFNLLMKKKFSAWFQACLKNLKRFCEDANNRPKED